MKQRYRWIAALVTMWSGVMVMAQPPAQTPMSTGSSVLGYPGYPSLPAPPQSPRVPVSPFGLTLPYNPTFPNGPGLPNEPMLPNGPGLPSSPALPALPEGPMPPSNPGGSPTRSYTPYGPGAPNGATGFPGQPFIPNGPGAPNGATGFPGQPFIPNGPGAPNGASGFPGQPFVPNGPGAPNGASGFPGQPFIPNSPGAPNGPGTPNGPPSSPYMYNGVGPKPGAAEPYLVPPEGPPHHGPAPHVAHPPAPPIMHEPMHRLMQFIAPSGPTEPYTMYEGPRYQAEMRQDETRVWVQANFIHWWFRRDFAPPLVTTGDPAIPGSGSIGTPGTAILLGNGAIGPREFSGIQANVGMWLDEERLQSLEVGGFWLGRNSRQHNFSSDAAGNPLLGVPFQDPMENIFLISSPVDGYAGSVHVNSFVDFHGVELNVARNMLRLHCCSLDSLVGLRYLYLHENLAITQVVTDLVGGTPFNNAPQPAGTTFVFSDSFNITNRFYGAQIGARVNWTYCGFDVGAVVKLGLGATTHTAAVDGSTTLSASGASAVGGSFAQASNIGRRTETDFTVVPEVTATVGYQVTPHIRVLTGYTYLYWDRVERAGTLIDRQVDRRQVPSDVRFVPGLIGANPLLQGTRTPFWAQGINVGLELRY